MKLKELLKGLDYIAQEGVVDIDINNVIADSRLVRKGDLFVAITGENHDGHNFIKESLQRGAGAVIIEKDVDIDGLKKIKVKDTRRALALLAKNFYNKKRSKKIKIIGVTGTNGKTTITYLLEGILKCAGFRVGLIGTIKYKIDDEEIEPDNTTPSPLILQNLIKKMQDRSVDYCVMEVSSHGLDQHRTDCVDFDIALFANATREHLDYHKNFKNYLDSKLKLFKGLKEDSLAVINRDDPNFDKVRESSSSKRIKSFGLKKDADVYASDIQLDINGTSFAIHTHDKAFSVNSHLIGWHNVYNMLGAATCAIMEGIDLGTIKKGLEDIKGIPGRLQPIDAGTFKLFIDFGHTDDALKKVLISLRELKKNRIITVFGCGGNRDRKKRPRMGKVATRLSDYAIITSDNPRDEDPQGIANEIVKGIDRDLRNFKVILNRQDAIREALAMAEEDDIVLIAGKGHERFQIIKEEKIPFDDVEVVKGLLKTRCLV